jgi:hypothetical protein
MLLPLVGTGSGLSDGESIFGSAGNTFSSGPGSAAAACMATESATTWPRRNSSSLPMLLGIGPAGSW